MSDTPFQGDTGPQYDPNNPQQSGEEPPQQPARPIGAAAPEVEPSDDPEALLPARPPGPAAQAGPAPEPEPEA